ncbi:hypothetical protein Tco_1022891 [Tanacetum coccineum]
MKHAPAVVFKKQVDGGGDEHAPVIVDFESPVSGVVRGVVDDVEVAAVTSLPLRRNAKIEDSKHMGNGECRTASKVGAKSGDVAEVFTGVKKQLDVVQGENVAVKG